MFLIQWVNLKKTSSVRAANSIAMWQQQNWKQMFIFFFLPQTTWEWNSEPSSQEKCTALQHKIILLISEGILLYRKKPSDMLGAMLKGHALLLLSRASVHYV